MRGILIGKFYPPHLGHHHLINTALKQCKNVTVLIVDNPKYCIPAKQRVEWLKKEHPSADIKVIPDIEKDDDSAAWAEHTIRFLGYAPDLVFSSEQYGITWAKCMRVKHVMVDLDRKAFPISATQVRNDLLANWNCLRPVVKADLARRIVVVGAESTGTTTLSTDIAKALKSLWVPELGRYYTMSLLPSKRQWLDDDFYTIGKLQQQYESAIAKNSNGLVVCDTNASATQLWQERYMGRVTKTMQSIAAQDKAHLYILTGDEIPFVQDGLRDGEHIRHAMHDRFQSFLYSQAVPWLEVSGNPQKRLRQSLDFITQNLTSRITL